MKRWYHIWCERCGMDKYISMEPKDRLASIGTCRCGANDMFGGYHEDDLGIGEIRFEEVKE